MSGPSLFAVSMLLGLVAGALHASMLKRAIDRAVERRSPVRLLLFAPLRVLVPVLVVLAVVPHGLLAVAGALSGIVVASQIARWRAVRAIAASEEAT